MKEPVLGQRNTAFPCGSHTSQKPLASWNFKSNSTSLGKNFETSQFSLTSPRTFSIVDGFIGLFTHCDSKPVFLNYGFPGSVSGNGTGPIRVAWGPRVNNHDMDFVTWEVHRLQARLCCVWRHLSGRHPAGGLQRETRLLRMGVGPSPAFSSQ